MPSNKQKISKVTPTIVEKGWGREEIFANSIYCGKLLIFDKNGYEGSTHLHIEKVEHFRVLSGEFKLKCIDTTNANTYFIDLKEGDVVHIPNGCPHKIICIKAGTILEVSTPDSDGDSYRIEKGDSQREPKKENPQIASSFREAAEILIKNGLSRNHS